LRGAVAGRSTFGRKPSECFSFLAPTPGRVLSKQDLIEAIWPNVYVGEDDRGLSER
jgi:DNA-binding winged helix-turn-helix (wHTH) protein